MNALGNIEMQQDHAVFSVNPKIYPLELIYSAAYIMIDKAFIVLDGDPDKTIKIEVRKKKPEQDLKTLVMEFNEELLNYAVYKAQSERNKVLRETILQRVLLTNNPNHLLEIPKSKTETPKGITKPVEETPEDIQKEGDKKNGQPNG